MHYQTDLMTPAYVLTVSERKTCDQIPYTAYGLSFRAPDGHTVRCLEDISTSRQLVDKMAELFTLCQLPRERLIQTVTCLLP